MKSTEKLHIKWSKKTDDFLLDRYNRLNKLNVALRPLFVNLSRDNIYKGRDLTRVSVAVAYSTPVVNEKSRYSVADDDTEEAAYEISEALKARGLKTRLIRLDGKKWKELEECQDDVVFNLVEWTGKDEYLAAKVFEIFEEKKIVYTGSSWKSWMMTADKENMKNTFDRLGIATAHWQVFRTIADQLNGEWTYPAIVKPVKEHCSMGISQKSVVRNETELRDGLKRLGDEFGWPILVEEFLSGREFQVAVLERDGKPWVLPPAEISYKTGRSDWPLQTFEVRWDENISEIDDPSSDVFAPVIDHELLEKISLNCTKGFVGCGLSGYARADVRLREGEPYLLELNCNPGLGDHYSYGMTLSQWAVGMTLGDLCMVILEAALVRFGKV